MTDWYTTLPGLLDRTWGELTDSRNGDTAGRRPVLASIGADGGPQQRIVVLREVDRDAGLVRLHTDSATPKVAEFARNPAASLHLWNDAESFQIRLRGSASVGSGADVAQAWAAVPDASRGNYGVDPVPGTVIGSSGAYSRVAQRDRFAVISFRLESMDLVVLSPDHHRRARFMRADDWAGEWLAP